MTGDNKGSERGNVASVAIVSSEFWQKPLGREEKKIMYLLPFPFFKSDEKNFIQNQGFTTESLCFFFIRFTLKIFFKK